MMSITASIEYNNVWVQDVTQASTQRYDFKRDVHIKPASQFQLSPDTYRNPLKTLYEVSDSGDSLFQNTRIS